jgi:hypothetical protein
LLVPLLVLECSPIEFGLNGPCGNTPEELRASANELLDLVTSLTLEIDGVSVPKEKLFQYRGESPRDGFTLIIAPNNAFGLTEESFPRAPRSYHLNLSLKPLIQWLQVIGLYCILCLQGSIRLSLEEQQRFRTDQRLEQV